MHVLWDWEQSHIKIRMGLDHVIVYASRACSKTEYKYLAHKLEFLALKWAIMEHFHKYLCGNTFNVYMDNNLLTYILASVQLDATGQHWVASLANYNFILNYKSGKMNVDANALYYTPSEEHDQHIEADSVCALISHVAQGTTLIEAYSCNIQVTETLDMQKDPKAMSLEDWIMAQSQDPAIREIKYLINKNKLKRYNVYSWDPQIMKQYPRQHSHLVLCKGSYTGE